MINASKRRRVVYMVLTGLVLTLFLLIPLNIDFFTVHTIELTGTRIVPAERIYRQCAPIKGRNIFRFGKRKLIRSLERIPQVHHVRVSRRLPGKLIITVVEKKPWINLLHNNSHLIIDSNGFILNLPGSNEINSTALPVVRARSNSAPRDYRIDMSVLHLVRMVLSPLETVFVPEKLNINLVDSNDIEILADDILLIKIGNTDEIEEKHAVIKTFLTYIKNRWDEVEYIDVKSATHPVIKFRQGP